MERVRRECLAAAASAVQGDGIEGSWQMEGSKWAKGGAASCRAPERCARADRHRQAPTGRRCQSTALGRVAVGLGPCSAASALAEHSGRVSLT